MAKLTKILEILIVMAILFMLALFFGCKDEAQDPNDWVFLEPDNPILYIGYDTIRLQPGSSIKYIEIGDPNVVVTHFEPNDLVNIAIQFDSDAPEGFIIKDCLFYMVSEPEPNEPDGKNWEIKELSYSPIYDRDLSAEEIAEINRELSEPNEPEELTYGLE